MSGLLQDVLLTIWKLAPPEEEVTCGQFVVAGRNVSGCPVAAPEADLEAVRPDLAAWSRANLEEFRAQGDPGGPVWRPGAPMILAGRGRVVRVRGPYDVGAQGLDSRADAPGSFVCLLMAVVFCRLLCLFPWAWLLRGHLTQPNGCYRLATSRLLLLGGCHGVS
jgi:hypothetical protein